MNRPPKKVVIMQPYFLPYIGYWQLMFGADVFVVYDNVEFTKKGWINRNRCLLNGRAEVFSIPVKKDSDYLSIVERQVAGTFAKEKGKLIRKLEASYCNAPFFDEGIELFISCMEQTGENLFDIIYQSIVNVKNKLQIETELVVSSSLQLEEGLRGQDRVIAICKSIGATHYINPIGGKDIYDKKAFNSEDISLSFQRVKSYTYKQFSEDFIPHLSIIDVVMFNGTKGAASLLTEMELC